MQNKILKREEKIPKKTKTPDVPELKPKVKKVEKSLDSPTKKNMKVSLSTTFNSPATKKPKVSDLPFSPAKQVTTSMNYMQRENSMRLDGPPKKVVKKNAQSFVSATTKSVKVKPKKIEESPASRKKSMQSHLMYGMFSPDKKTIKSPVNKRKKSAGTLTGMKKQPSSKYWNQSYMATKSPKRTAKTPQKVGMNTSY